MTAEPFSMNIEAGKVVEFARAVRVSDSDELVNATTISSPTYLMAAAFWRNRENEVIDHTANLDRSLHASEEFIFHGPPPRAGATLIGSARLGPVTHKSGRRGGNMDFTEVVTEFRDIEGRLVVENYSVTVVVENPPTRG
jgi:hypothetical protein